MACWILRCEHHPWQQTLSGKTSLAASIPFELRCRNWPKKFDIPGGSWWIKQVGMFGVWRKHWSTFFGNSVSKWYNFFWGFFWSQK